MLAEVNSGTKQISRVYAALKQTGSGRKKTWKFAMQQSSLIASAGLRKSGAAAQGPHNQSGGLHGPHISRKMYKNTISAVRRTEWHVKNGSNLVKKMQFAYKNSYPEIRQVQT